MNTAYLAMGSNLGDREENIARARELLHEHPHIEVITASPLHESPALTKDGAPQPDYLNGAVEIRTSLLPLELLDELQAIEEALGRPADHGSWEPRTIDLDILIYDAHVIDHPRLTVPHPEIAKRTFVLQPLCDIAPDLDHPTKHQTMRDLYDALTQTR